MLTQDLKENKENLESRQALGDSDFQMPDKQKRLVVFDLFKNSYAVWAVLALIALDLFLRFNWQNLPLDHYASPNRSMVWWNVDDFRKQDKAPDLVLMGSSLLMHALHGGDAEYLQLPQNEVYHHKCVLLEDQLKKLTGKEYRSFAFALAGQMASDAYAIADTLFTNKRKPEIIIYNIAPRDFIDNTLASPASTEIFRFMSRLGGVRDAGFQARSGLWEKVEYGLENISAIYAHRHYFVFLQQRYAQGILKALGQKPSQEVHTPFKLRRLALLELPEDMGINERIAMPNLPASFVDNSDEYLKRYQPFKEKKFQEQLRYLDKLFAFCRKQNIKLILVNMPLSPENIRLMPPGTYQLYKNKMAEMAAKYGSNFIDMQDEQAYDRSLFCDTAHMNGRGGLKYFQELAVKLSKLPQFSSSVSLKSSQ